MKDKNMTLKDLMKTYKKESFHECFGIPKERGFEMVKIIEELIKKVHKVPTWSPAELLKELANADIAKDFRETALVVFLVGCHIGEDSVYQALAGNALKNIVANKVRKGDGYVN